MDIGIVIIDNTTLKHFEPPQVRERVRASCRMLGFTVHVSAVNILEACTTANEVVFDRLRAVLKSFMEYGAVLPWPLELLRTAGENMLAGDDPFEAHDREHAWLLDHPEEVRKQRAELLNFVEGVETDFDAMHDGARNVFRPFLKSQGVKDIASSARAFLEGVWQDMTVREHFARITWRRLGLPAPAPIERLLNNDIWRIYLDVEGAAMFERALAAEQPQRTHRLDLLQLLYMAGGTRRLFLAEDRSLLRTARHVLEGRYPNARVMAAADFIAQHSAA